MIISITKDDFVPAGHELFDQWEDTMRELDAFYSDSMSHGDDYSCLREVSAREKDLWYDLVQYAKNSDEV